MTSFTILSVGVVVALFLYRLHHHLNNTSKARKAGCGSAPEPPRPFWDLLNFTHLYNMISRARQGELQAYACHLPALAAESTGFTVRTVDLPKLGSHRLLTSDPVNVHAILNAQFADFEMGDRKNYTAPLLGEHSIFVHDGPEWKHSRSLIRSIVTRERVSDLAIFQANSTMLIAALRQATSVNHNSIELQQFFLNYTFRTSLQFTGLEEVSAAAQNVEDWRNNNFEQAFDTLQLALQRRFVLGKNLYWLTNTPSLRKASELCRSTVEQGVQRAISRAKTRMTGGTDAKQSFFAETILDDIAQSTTDPEVLRSMGMSLLLAGRDTTASLLSWLFYHLSLHPESYKQLRHQVLQDFGTADCPSQATFETLKSCEYLQWCIKEALRMQPPVAFGMKTAARDTTLPRGGGSDGLLPVFVPQGTEVLYNMYQMHRDEELWGADADEWKPERWCGRKHGREYVPFNAGPRICPGQQLALTNAAYVTMRLCQQFESIEGCNGVSEPRVTAGLVVLNMDGVNVHLHEAIQ